MMMKVDYRLKIYHHFTPCMNALLSASVYQVIVRIESLNLVFSLVSFSSSSSS